MDAPESHDGCFFGDGQQQPTNWELGECIGRGNFTMVHLVKDIYNLKDINCVVKHAIISDDANKKYLAQVDVEIRTLNGLNHVRIVEYHGFSRTIRQLSLFTPYMEKGSVATYMKSKQEEHLSEEESARFTHQILEGLEYLHRKRVIHRDIKGSNILMVDDQNIKIADFGVATILNTLSSATTKGVGSFNWMAPELFIQAAHTNAVDIWSLGCTVYQMLTGTIPFEKMASALIIGNVIAKKHELSVPDDWPEGFKRFLRLACKQDPNERPRAKDLLNFDFWSMPDADEQMAAAAPLQRPQHQSEELIFERVLTLDPEEQMAGAIPLQRTEKSVKVRNRQPLENINIECEIVYPDGKRRQFIMQQMKRLVRNTKHAILLNEDLYGIREEDVYLEMLFSGGERREMEDNQILDYYREDLCHAERIHIRVRNTPSRFVL